MERPSALSSDWFIRLPTEAEISDEFCGKSLSRPVSLENDAIELDGLFLDLGCRCKRQTTSRGRFS